MSIGEKLRAARETKCLSIKDLANDTHLDENLLRELEADDFHAITAPIYGVGFLKLCANRLGLDPAPLLEEFKQVYRSSEVTVSKSVVGDYRAQEALYRERAGASQIFRRSAYGEPEPETLPRPMASVDPSPKPETHGPVVEVQESRVPEVQAPIPEAAGRAPEPPASFEAPPAGGLETGDGQPPTGDGVPQDAPRGPIEAPGAVSGGDSFAALFGRPAAESDAPAAPQTLEEDEDSLFSPSVRRPKPLSVDTEDDRPRPRTGIYVPPSRRAVQDVRMPEAGRKPAEADERPVRTPDADERSARASDGDRRPEAEPKRLFQREPKPPREGPGPWQKAAAACREGALAAIHALGVFFGAVGRGAGHGLCAFGRGLWRVLCVLGVGLAALGHVLFRYRKSIALVGAGLAVVALGVWAVAGILGAIRSSRDIRVAQAAQQAAAAPPPVAAFVEMTLPPPILYAE